MRTSLLGLLLAATTACVQGDVTLSKDKVDADGDGYTTDVDCDDAHASVNPDAVELCDELDNDCDGETDEAATDAPTRYADADGDGYGDPAVSEVGCDLPPAWVPDGTDCDDTNPDIHPDAPEPDCTDPVDYNCDGSAAWADTDGDGWAACEDCDDTTARVNPAQIEVCDPDNVDEDCSGAADDADPAVDASGFSTWYADADGDTYGDAASPSTQCDQPVATVADNTDCADSDSAVNPAGTEVCDDGLDNDCDGFEADCGDIVYAEGSASGADGKLYGDATLDYFGTGLVTGIDLDGDGATNLVVGASGASNGKAYLYNGAFASTPASATAFDTGILEGNTTHGVGLTLFAIHDVDSDGYDELAVSTSGGETLYLLEGEDLTGTVSVTSTSAIFASIATTYTAASGGDFNATTGTDEWFAGDYSAASSAGEVYVYTGATALYTVSGEAADDRAGYGLAGGPASDVDGDGYDELFVGASGNDAGGSGAGAAYVVLGPLGGDLSLSAADGKLLGGAAGDGLGYHLLAAGDLDADGHGDLVVGAVYADDGGTSSGAVYAFCDLDPAASPDASVADAEAVVVGEAANDLLGWPETLAVGDLDDDGTLDLVVGSQFSDIGGSTSVGAAWHVPGPLAGSYPLSDSLSYATTWRGDDASDSCASSLGLGDLDGDGVVDLLLGCGYGDEGSTADVGAVYFFAGG